MRKEKYKNIVCFGEVLWDILPTGAKPGGAPLNVAIHLKRQGLNPIIISKIGQDNYGKLLLEFLSESNLNTDYIQVDDQLETSRVLIHLDKNKNATYEICEPVAWDNILFTTKSEKIMNNAQLIIYGSLASRNKTSRKTLLKLLKGSSAKRLVDVNLRPPYDNRRWIEELLSFSDFAKLNDDELIKIASWNNQTGNEESLIQWFSSYFKCSTVCVTRGANGAVLFINKQFYSHQGFTVNAVDTVGAGDSFLAGLIANLSKEIAPQKALEYACATGAFVASKKGAVPNYDKKDIQKIIIPE